MITEAQRRALFALREALHLCEGAHVRVYMSPGYDCLETAIDFDRSQHFGDMRAEDITAVIAEHPES